MAADDFVLDSFQALAEKLGQLTTPDTDEVIMMGIMKPLLISGIAVTNLHLVCQPTVKEQLERPINGGKADRGIHLLDLLI